MFSHEHEAEMTRRYRKDHDLMGFEADDLLSVFDTLGEKDIWQYRYPDDSDLNSIGVRGIYLGNYVRWDPKVQHEQMMREYGYKTSAFNRTFDCYDYVDCFNYMDVHDLLKLYKHGFSKVTDHASREIRFGRITREQGLSLVRRYEQKPLKYFELFCEWLNVTPRALNFILDQHRNERYWENCSPGVWEFRGLSHLQAGNSSFKKHEVIKNNLFISNSNLEHKKRAKYIIFGKGYPQGSVL